VTSIKDQGGCGSCVSFGTIATLESMVIIERNIVTDLSEAELLFCGGGSCGGWWPDSAVTYLKNRGVAQETCFPYLGHNMPCTVCSRRDGEAIKVTGNTAISDVSQRKDYLAWVGPTMCVFQVYDDFFGYGSGVYSHVTGGLAGLHCVEVIGYDDCGGYWICKNSWGSGWGEAGFFRIAYGQCEIDTNFPFWGISGTEWWK
jgi:C1A family cysteine protease